MDVYVYTCSHMATFDEKENIMSDTYLTTTELAQRIREQLKDSVLLEGTHYFRPFGGRKILFIWESIERDMLNFPKNESLAVPMANGGVCRG